MLLKINKTKNLGIFVDYTWNPALPTFERYNVIYGDNGSGKTTLSRLLSCLNVGTHDNYPDLEFNIDTQSGELVHGRSAIRKIRVFNSDYVQLNIGQLDSALKPILVIGEENKAVADTLAAEEKELQTRQAVLAGATDSITRF